MKYLFLSALFLSVEARAVSSSICYISINRTACPGREEEAYAPYNGVNPTTQNIPYISEAQCKERAAISAKIVRRFILRKIEVIAVFNGNPLMEYRAEGPCASASKRGFRK